MKKNKQNTVKANQTVSNIETSNLQKINLSALKADLDKIDLKEKKVKETIYRYPEGWTKDKINSEEGKKFRNKLRNQLKSLCNNILYYAKGDDQEKLQEKVKEFRSFYKTHYRVNDLSLQSITNSEKREKDIELMIKIVKLYESK